MTSFDFRLTLGKAYPTTWNPNHCFTEVMQENHDWVAAQGLLNSDSDFEKFKLVGAGGWSSFTYTDANPNLVRLAADFIAWLFIFDDYFGEGALLSNRDDQKFLFDSYVMIMRDSAAVPTGSPLHASLKSLMDRFRKYFDQAWIEIFCQSNQEYMYGCLTENFYRQNRKTPDYQTYRSFREDSIGARPVFDIAEATLPRLLTGVERRSEIYLEIRSLGALLCAQINDIISYPKERNDGDPNNVVTVLRQEFSINEVQALQKAIEIHNEDLARLKLLAHMSRSTDNAVMSEYVAAIEKWVKGTYFWSIRSRRYQIPL